MVEWIVMMVRMALVYKRVPYIKTVEHLWHTLKTCAIASVENVRYLCGENMCY